MLRLGETLPLSIDGVGIICYSPSSVIHISEGEDYFSTNYSDDVGVQRHIQGGTIVGFCTGTSGDFLLDLKSGYPSDYELASAEFKLRLAIVCRDEHIIFRDIYHLTSWTKHVPETQKVSLDNGIYHITLCSNSPESGVLGDCQTISVFFNRLNNFPKLGNVGIPHLMS